MKTRLLAEAAVLALLCGGLASGQHVQGPVMGFVVDGSQIRPILGVPGAAVVGAPLKTGGPLTVEAVSPAGNYVLVSREDRVPAIWTPGSKPQTLTDLPAGTYRVALSPAGTAAAFYSQTDGRMRVISGLPDAPSAVSEIPLDSLEAALQNFTVSDDGQLVLCAEAATEAGSAAVVLGPSGKLNRITLPGAVSALNFGLRSHDAVIASGSTALLVRRVDAPGATTPLNASNAGAIGSAALASDGRHVLLAQPDSGKIAVVESDSGEAATIDCHCTLEGLTRINENTYRLDSYDGSAIRILDTASTPARVLVVPVSSRSDNSQ